MSGAEGWKALSMLATGKKLPNEFVLAVAGAGSNSQSTLRKLHKL